MPSIRSARVALKTIRQKICRVSISHGIGIDNLLRMMYNLR